MNKMAGLLALLILVAIGAYIFVPKREFPVVPKSENSITIPVEVFAKNLEVPWALVFLQDGNLLVTERKGTVKLISKDGQAQQVGEISGVKQISESGLHGIALHPNFPANKYVYLYYTYGEDIEQTLNRVVRMTFVDNQLKDEKIIIDKIPGAANHDGGRIKFGPDGFLYVTTGDAQEPSRSQDKNSLAGKILRVTDDGSPAPGNPFGTRIYSYGHRNPQGITWDETGNLWETEHGSSTMDELNKIEPGKNYGWPTVRGDQTGEGFMPPVIHSGSDTWAPAGAAYLNGSIYFAGLRGQAFYQAILSQERLTLKTYLKGEYGRIRDVIVGPDNMLYISISNRDGRGLPKNEDDKILRVNPGKL